MNRPIQMDNQDLQDKRQHRRFSLASAATVRHNNRVSGLYWIRNISIGGALLHGRESFDIGTTLKVLLHLPWINPLNLESRVIHQSTPSKHTHELGLQFRHFSASSSSTIAEAIRSAEVCARWPRKPTVLLITDRASIRYDLERDLGLLGVRCLAAETPLDAIRWLQDWEIHIDTVIVDLWIEQANVLSLLKFLVEEYPRVQRIMITDAASTQLTRIASAYGRVAGVIQKPWSRSGLAAVLGAGLQETQPEDRS